MRQIHSRVRFASPVAGILAVAAMCGTATGHHSLAMYDREHPIELVGIVREFKFTSPHALIVLEVLGEGAQTVIWRLEGDSPNSLHWDGWSSQSLKPGDEVRLAVEPLRSGARGGGWHARSTTFKDGTPVAVIRAK
jgi:Family of unknown function (DUF6152)